MNIYLVSFEVSFNIVGQYFYIIKTKPCKKTY